jgi:Uma2 family endonuclease
MVLVYWTPAAGAVVQQRRVLRNPARSRIRVSRERGTVRWAETGMTTSAHLTLDQFLQLPEQEPALEFDSDGTIHEKISPNTEHGALQAHLARLLLNWIDVDPLRRRGYVYTELRTNVGGASKLPDVAFYRQRPRESARKHALEVADVAVEILSPRDDLEEQRAKCQWYVEHGAQLAMLVDPGQRSVTLFGPLGHLEVVSGGSTLVLVPGLELALDDIFNVLDL